MLITSKGKVLHYLIYIITFICLNPNIFGKSKLANKNQEKQYVNRLAKESSPYLLQHKNNPVDWYPWGDEAFQKATELNRPIFLSIGYSTCHWCHVMEDESFEDEQVAQLLNDNFISIKVDREERPEIDHLYMTVCQAMTGKGGWPLTIIMTPDKYPFFAGTYFPKKGRMGRPGMIELLPAIADAWVNKKGELIQPKHIMALTTLGIRDLYVKKKPKIIFFGTGNEIVDYKKKNISKWEVRNSNNHYFTSFGKNLHYQIIDGGVIKDNQQKKLKEKLKQTLKSDIDIFVTSGAVSAGKFDFIPKVIKQFKLKSMFKGVNIRPGKPIMFAKFKNRNQSFFGLPGNPISVSYTHLTLPTKA